MSKASKKLSRQRNLQQKRARKVANKAKYESWRLAGENSKSKKKNNKNKLANTISHPDGKCGNIGCKKCNI